MRRLYCWQVQKADYHTQTNACEGTRDGIGRHEWDLNPATVADSSVKIVKVSILMQLHELWR